MWYHVPGSVLNVTISWYGITVTISQSWQQQHAKYNTIVHDNTCTKWNNNDWSYPGYGSKCGIIVVMVLLLWSYPGYSTKCDSSLFVYQSSLCPCCVWNIHR